ncbi:MAG: DUF3422 domain-containing protein [Lamprobacter sp.]|uniref:DUF3422 family protein n=1 Tax=Lamprobacter sp. TaxID=3100796 RepID=UPI002B25B06E|nr:DUF3422 domain-containing protein [Lamprobacter sp.]MEA3639134.1 DUF3422 domain-containing protein [Lamprobacter sp.]
MTALPEPSQQSSALPFPVHPLRELVTSELHARTFDPLQAPVRIAHLAYLCGERGSGSQKQYLARLLSHFGIQLPPHVGLQYATDLGGLWLRWERHTEFVTYTLSREGPFTQPFAPDLLGELPQVWLRNLPGQVVTAVQLALESADMPERGLDELVALFGGHPVIGAQVAGGAGFIWSDLRIHADGFGHILLRDRCLSDGQAGRLIKRVLEINAYRAMALLGLPAAREASQLLSEAEQRLAGVASRMVDGNQGLASMSEAKSAPKPADGIDLPPERELLAELTALAAEIESVAAETATRFDASQAYYQVVRQRLEQLREERIQGVQTLSEFLDARLAPAIATCTATAQRQQHLAERAARVTALLRARVEVQLQEQNRALLDSMDRRAKLQLRLQETVEGLSVVAISYYGVGLIGYLLKGFEASGWPLDATLGIGIAMPIVVGAAWLGLRQAKRRLLKGAE